jgi:hypothetical protein
MDVCINVATATLIFTFLYPCIHKCMDTPISVPTYTDNTTRSVVTLGAGINQGALI